MLSLSDLIAPRSKQALLANCLQALRGIGWVKHEGSGSGTVSASGTALVSASVVVELLTPGALGEATFRYSLDGGSTWSTSALVPASGSYVLGTTGATLTFVGSLVAGDRYSFAIAAPTLPTSAWQAGSVPLTLLEVDALALEDLETLIAKIAAGGFVDFAERDWLDLLSESFYGLSRIQAKYTRGTRTLTALATSGPHAITAGSLRATTASGRRFVNVTGGVLAAGGTLALEWQAESPGAAWNVASTDSLSLITSLPGVTFAVEEGGPTDWISDYGDDKEPDSQLRARCKGRWSELGIATTETYETWARAAATGNRKVQTLEDPDVPGRVLVYVAPVIGGTANAPAAQEYIDARAPLTSTAVVAEATPVEVSITGTVEVAAGNVDSAKAAAASALTNLFDETPIGGNGGVLSAERVIGWIAVQAGVRNLAVDSPSIDIEIPAGGNATFDPALPGLTWVEV